MHSFQLARKGKNPTLYFRGIGCKERLLLSAALGTGLGKESRNSFLFECFSIRSVEEERGELADNISFPILQVQSFALAKPRKEIASARRLEAIFE